VAVTGIVDDGLWSALNARTLNIPERFALVETVANLAGSHVLAANDAQAAAWGEYRFGAGRGTDMVFLTISTGIGGGIVVNGRLLGGMAGNFGQFVGDDDAQGPLEDRVSREVFAAADEGLGWANAILDISAGRVARLARNIQFALDPARIVIGGGIGLVPSYLDRVRQALTEMPARLRPDIHAAALGGNAGIIGIADLARHNPTGGERT
jgi:N-acylmannosamine kinase/N-acetylmannosamine-6-phosphate 2-epimerase/N-acetylmannosamine kinase